MVVNDPGRVSGGQTARPGLGCSGMPTFAVGLPAAHQGQPDHRSPGPGRTSGGALHLDQADVARQTVPARREALTDNKPQAILGADGESILRLPLPATLTNQRGPTS